MSRQWIYVAIAGGGIGLMLTAASTDAVNRAPSTSYSEATGITQTARNFGAGLGLAVLGSVLIHRADTNVSSALTKAASPAALRTGSPPRSGPGRRPLDQAPDSHTRSPRRTARVRALHPDRLLHRRSRHGRNISRRGPADSARTRRAGRGGNDPERCPDFRADRTRSCDEDRAMNANVATAESATAQIVTKLSPWSVTDTVARLSAIVAAKELKLFAVVDHSGEAESLGLKLRDTKVVIFGSPETGTPVMQAAPLAALDLPLKVLVWLGRAPDDAELYGPSRARGSLRPKRGAREPARWDRRDHRRGHRPLTEDSNSVPPGAPGQSPRSRPDRRR